MGSCNFEVYIIMRLSLTAFWALGTESCILLFGYLFAMVLYLVLLCFVKVKIDLRCVLLFL